MTTTFRDLDVGREFTFESEHRAGWPGARGPWVKTGARSYREATQGPEALGHVVGTTAAHVRPAPVWAIALADFPIELLQDPKSGEFTVVYGADVQAGCTYNDAGLYLGAAILHALTCEGKIHDGT